VQKKHNREDGMMQSQRLLLTWLVERPELYGKLQAYIDPSDFTEGIYATVAAELFGQFEAGGELNPARIVSRFADEEEQRQVAEIFNTSVQGMETAADWEKAIRETLIRVKQNSLEQKRRHLDPTDMDGLKQMIEDKRRLQEMERLHISLD
jgi:DNA primase